jgi:hypothetical protein
MNQLAQLIERVEKLEAVLLELVDAYTARFGTGGDRLFGPIDEQIIAARKLLKKSS